MSDNPPPALAKRGLQRIVENADSQEIQLPPGLLMMFFGNEIKERLMVRDDAPQPKRRRVLFTPKG